ncbi:MAG: M23 family metallopeptidase [bacterium]|nr:M23 family metallopeptidase [bacterium]
MPTHEVKADPPAIAPLTWPAVSTLTTSPFGPRLKVSDADRFDWHQGIDIGGTNGENIYSIADGTVDGVYTEGSPQYPDGGNVIRVRHYDDNADRYYSVYMHLKTMAVAKDDPVNAGDVIGTMGQSGDTTFDHLHFELRELTSCSLESQNGGGCPTSATGEDPHMNPIEHLFASDVIAPTVSVESF